MSLGLVVPCYRHCQFLKTTIESIKLQTRPFDEIVFVNDCSPDATSTVLAELVSENSMQAKIIRNSANLGQAASINIGVSELSTTHVMVLNDDDYLMEDVAETSVSVFNKHPSVHMVGGSSIAFVGSPPHPRRISVSLGDNGLNMDIRTPEMAMRYSAPNDLNMTHSSSAFTKHAWASSGGYFPKEKRLFPWSDRDFQVRVNRLFPVAVTTVVPFAFWREGSSVDCGTNS